VLHTDGRGLINIVFFEGGGLRTADEEFQDVRRFTT
jgi:hypothetical protein